MIIVAGNLAIQPGKRDEFIQRSTHAVTKARADEACNDFAVSPDPLDPNRVNIYEQWKTRQALENFRSSGPGDDLFTLVASFNVAEYEVPDGDD